MAFSMKDITTGAIPMPRKVIIYGPPKLGKSTLVGSTKGALLIPTEDRVAHIDCAKTPVVHKMEEILEIFDFVLSDSKKTYNRIIIDSLDWLEPILHKHLCKKFGYASITDDHNKDTAFQKGLKYVAVEGWKNFLHNCDILRENGIDVIFTAHDQVIVKNPPDNDPFDKFVMKIDKNALSIVEEWADIIGFYDKEVFVVKDGNDKSSKGNKATTTNKRVLHLSGRNPAMISGNSFGLGDAVVTLEDCSEIMEWLLTETETVKKTNKKEGK